MRFPPALLDEIRARLPVSQVVTRRVNLKRQGREFVGLSPFKAEKSPSFTVNDVKGFYHCFASGEHGDIFTFLMKTEGLSFPEAVERLAGEAGVPMPKSAPEAERAAEDRGRLVEVTEAAAKFYQTQLSSGPGRGALAYLQRRGLDGDVVKEFRIGFAPDSRSAVKDHLARLGFSAEEVARAGMVVSGPDIPVPYDRFRNRVIIPIPDLKGRIIAFGGRALADEQKPKYLNSPDTDLFHKGRILFNAARARPAAHDRNTVVVVEGYMDVIALHRAGIPYAVAPLGTALTEDQIRLLWRMAPEPVLCFDGDAAGQKAAFRAADAVLPLLEPGRSLRFAFLPSGLDPDDLVRTQGPQAVRNVLAAARSLIDVLWMRERDSAPLDTPERRAALEQRIGRLVEAIREPHVKDEYARELRSMLKTQQWQTIRALGRRENGAAAGRIDAKQVDWRTRERAPGAPRGKAKASLSATTPYEELRRSRLVTSSSGEVIPREALILKTLINHPRMIDDHAEALSALDFKTAAFAGLRDALMAVHAARGPLDSGELATHLMRSGLQEALDLVAGAITHKSDRFAEPDASEPQVDRGLRHLLALQHRAGLEDELKRVEMDYHASGSDDALDEMVGIRRKLQELDARGRDEGMSGSDTAGASS